ncbi:MAG: hypothetical protein U9O53_04660 [archaeon]|nr:hypothetical protein [archaeon]
MTDDIDIYRDCYRISLKDAEDYLDKTFSGTADYEELKQRLDDTVQSNRPRWLTELYTAIAKGGFNEYRIRDLKIIFKQEGDKNIVDETVHAAEIAYISRQFQENNKPHEEETVYSGDACRCS